MKNGHNLKLLQQQQKEQDSWVIPQTCHVCNKALAGAYGHTTLEGRTVWSCGRACEQQVRQLKHGERNGLFATNLR